MDNEDDVELELRTRAYAIWQDDGQPDGKHLEHWQQAVKESEQAKEAPKTLDDAAPGGVALRPKLSRA
jgi:hypothetical protein